MGTCQNNSVIEINSNKRRPNGDIGSSNQDGIKIAYDPDFPDMKEWSGKRYKGIGIKKMKGYKCSLPIDELNQKRSEFWHAKCSTSHTWQYIQQACIYDECILYPLSSFIVRSISVGSRETRIKNCEWLH